jgi:hypothetical protein
VQSTRFDLTEDRPVTYVGQRSCLGWSDHPDPGATLFAPGFNFMLVPQNQKTFSLDRDFHSSGASHAASFPPGFVTEMPFASALP